MNPAQTTWTPLTVLKSRFEANIAALTTREPALADSLRNLAPSQDYHILPSADRILLGVGSAPNIRALPETVPPALARKFISQLCPTGFYREPILVAGEDLGWMWNCIYQLPCTNPIAPGYRAPAMFLMKDIERLWVILHIQEWSELLADDRVRLFVGSDAYEQFRESLVSDSMCGWAKYALTIDQAMWPAGVTFESTLADAKAIREDRLAETNDRLRKYYSQISSAAFAERFASRYPLKVLGITSRYTTFLQYSMRDWLAGIEKLGHTVQLFIEPNDHSAPNSLCIAQACDEFKPDLVVIIDHFRKEMPGLPDDVPVVMWAQDYMPNIYRAESAAAQRPRDYVMGFAYEKLKLVYELGYPKDRYFTATIGTDPARFAPRPAGDSRLAKYVCDVSFVTNASTPADQIIQEQITRTGPESKRVLTAIYDRMAAIYEAGGCLVAPPAVNRIISQGLLDCGIQSSPELMTQLHELFYLRVNNALFRHQSLHWLADMDIDFRLYGKGWENHRTFSRYARGVANNTTELSLIYQASRINLQISPLGSLHQRVMEGLASGGFFMLRRGDGDIIGRHYQTLWQYCQSSEIKTDAQLRSVVDPAMQQTLRDAIAIYQCDPFAEKYSFLQVLETMNDCDYLCSAGCVWGDDYDQVSFGSKAEMQMKVGSFLQNSDERARLSASMLQPVLERFTYEKTSQRLLEMIAVELKKQSRREYLNRIAA